jgi:hypothetical protein
MNRLKDNPLKVSAVFVFMVFGGTLYYLRKRLFWEDTLPVEVPVKVAADKPKKKMLSGIRNYLASKIQRIKKVKDKRQKP